MQAIRGHNIYRVNSSYKLSIYQLNICNRKLTWAFQWVHKSMNFNSLKTELPSASKNPNTRDINSININSIKRKNLTSRVVTRYRETPHSYARTYRKQYSITQEDVSSRTGLQTSANNSFENPFPVAILHCYTQRSKRKSIPSSISWKLPDAVERGSPRWKTLFALLSPPEASFSFRVLRLFGNGNSDIWNKEFGWGKQRKRKINIEVRGG